MVWKLRKANLRPPHAEVWQAAPLIVVVNLGGLTAAKPGFLPWWLLWKIADWGPVLWKQKRAGIETLTVQGIHEGEKLKSKEEQ